VRILDDNDEPPRFTQRQYEFTVAENQPADSTLGYVSAVDRDQAPNDRHSYYVDMAGDSDDDATSWLGVEPRTGRVFTRRPLDRERHQQFRLTLTVRDDVVVTLRDSATVVVKVTDDNDQSPEFTFPTASNDTAFVSADVKRGGRLVRVSALDRDSGNHRCIKKLCLRFGMHRVHDRRTIAIDDPRVCQYVKVSRGFTWLRCANTAERIEVLLVVETPGDLRNIALDGSPDFPSRIRCGLHRFTLVVCMLF